ncbi:hypothetical protein cyc_02263 [Cyclospora cayetanensis]|uniref:Uncharacterized protein n=1 Tax=Cyclospora cayetanensis TaxID=88456 RepID=A0A1D3D3I5_9EIME|nr:hypothetical protein cyc_02263 [Cyclospora cayetanensis]
MQMVLRRDVEMPECLLSRRTATPSDAAALFKISASMELEKQHEEGRILVELTEDDEEGGHLEQEQQKQSVHPEAKHTQPQDCTFIRYVTSIAEGLDEMPYDFLEGNINCQLPAAMVYEPLVQSIINCHSHIFRDKPKPARIGDRIIRAKRICPPSLCVGPV